MSLIDTSHLISRDKPRVLNYLDREFRFTIGVMTFGAFLEHHAETLTKSIGNNEFRYNRRAFNRMTGPQQERYLKNLQKPAYNVHYGDGFILEIPKMIFDALQVPVYGAAPLTQQVA